MSVRTKVFSSGQAAAVARIPYRTVDHWARSGFVEPSVHLANGTGTARRYSFDDLVTLAVVAQLKSFGFSTQSLRSVVAFLESGSVDRNALLACVDDGSVESVRNLQSLLGKRFFWVVNLPLIIESVKRAASDVHVPARGPAASACQEIPLATE